MFFNADDDEEDEEPITLANAMKLFSIQEVDSYYVKIKKIYFDSIFALITHQQIFHFARRQL